MFKLKVYTHDIDNNGYWFEEPVRYETYDKALLACYRNAVRSATDLRLDSRPFEWFEVDHDFEVTDTYLDACLTNTEDFLGYFPVAVICYDHAPWDRENDCDIEIVVGYDIVED